MEVRLRIGSFHYETLKKHLFPGDGLEAAALLLCGVRRGDRQTILTTFECHPIPYAACTERRPDRLSWKTEVIVPLLERAAKKGQSVVKVHSHPTGFETFSHLDDESDSKLFPSVHSWIETGGPHASAVMLPDGKMFGRAVDEHALFEALQSIAVADHDIHFWPSSTQDVSDDFHFKNAQAFGEGTIAKLHQMAVAVVGCSGTGSPVVEQLVRLGVGRLVLVDPDYVLRKNLNRILNATAADAAAKRPKVEMLKNAISRFGLGTEVECFETNLDDPAAVRAVASCDVVFGCMDTIEGRHVLNRTATFYVMPYFDLGVRLVADGKGGVSHVCGTVHYLRPGGSSLLSRGLYTINQLQAEGLRRTNPSEYEKRRKEGYIAGVVEERPAVISVNMQVASLAVNEFLARLHPYRQYDNSEFAIHRISLEQGLMFHEPESEPCKTLERWMGRGDVIPLLDMPSLSEERYRG